MAKRGLGRGLGALIPNIDRTSFDETKKSAVMEIPIDKIVPNKNQPRIRFEEESLNELAESIKQFGVLQPIIVRSVNGEDRYEIIAGERRFRASKKADMDKIPALVANGVDDTSSIEMALIENIHRENLGSMEQAYTYKQLIEEFKTTHEELAKKIGKSRAAITNSLRLLTLPLEVQKLLDDKELSEGHARAILALKNKETQIKIANRAAARGLSVREVEAAVLKAREPITEEKKPEVLQLSKFPKISQQISEYLDAPVKISSGRKKGKIVIEFGTIKDLERVVKKIVGE